MPDIDFGKDSLQELRRDSAAQKPVPVRREARVVPRRIVHPQAHASRRIATDFFNSLLGHSKA